MKLRSFKFFACLLFCTGSVNISTAFASEKDTIRMGIFIESLYDIDFADYSYQTNFWMWSVVKGDVNEDGKINSEDSIASLDRIKLIELSNAKESHYSRQMAFLTERNGKLFWWATQFCKANIYQKWYIDNYPFDDQQMALVFENTAYDTTQAIMLNTQDSISFKDNINLIGWTMNGGNVRSSITKYNTDFGDPNGNGTSYYSRVIFNINLERISPVAYFIKLCLGVFIAFLVALLAFAIGPPSLDSRFGLGVGALFAVAANKYVVDSSIPENAVNCLVDKIHEITFVYILFMLITSVVSLTLDKRKNGFSRKVFDWIAAAIIFISYVVILMIIGLKVD
jgi:hypothetical protein